MSLPIRTIAVLGASPTGCRLAGQLAGAGYRTILEDLSGQWRGPTIAGVEVAQDLHRVAAEADLILEAAPDDFETKFEVYTLIDRAAPPRSIFASTSPAWPVAEIASLTYRGPRVVGLWVHGDERLEVVAGPETSAATLEAVRQVVGRASGPSWTGQRPVPQESMERQNILLERQDRIWTLTFNRPDKRNALDAQTVAEAHDALAEVERAAGSAGAVVIVRGAGDKAFVSGADIGQLHKRTQHDALVAINQGLFTAVESFPWPTIAAVNGYALGGGFELALSCDIRVASETARFGFPETGLGIIPGAGGTQRLAWLVGLALAKELILTGDHVDAARALRSGVVSAVAPADQLQATAIAYAQRILSRGPLAIRMAKLAMNASSQAPLHAGLVVERLAQAICFGSTDKAEGTRAFLEKRQPDFKGR